MLTISIGLIIYYNTNNKKNCDYEFAKQVEGYIKSQYNMDLETTSLKYKYYDMGINGGTHWYFDFISHKYPDIKVTGSINYVKEPKYIRLDIEDIEFAKAAQDYLSSKYNTKFQTVGLRYNARFQTPDEYKDSIYHFYFKCNKYPKLFIEGSSKDKLVKNIILKNYPNK